MSAGPIVVVGSLNMDLVVRCAAAPAAGETVAGRSLQTHPGGKGANQAAAAACLGATVHMVGRVGHDGFGDRLRESLGQFGVDVTGVGRSERETGTALIVVEETGENRIVIVPGANADVVAADAVALLEAARGGQLLLQLETPLAAVEELAARAVAAGLRPVLNAAPAMKIPASLIRSIDHLVVNEIEAAVILGRALHSFEEECEALPALRAMGFARVTLTLGAKGALHLGRQMLHAPAPEVEVVDTTAAGDAFVGAFAAANAIGRTEAEALREAVAAGSLATTRPGAQPSLPSRSEVEALSERVPLRFLGE